MLWCSIAYCQTKGLSQSLLYIFNMQIIGSFTESKIFPLLDSDLKCIEMQIERVRSMHPGKFSRDKNRPDCFLRMVLLATTHVECIFTLSQFFQLLASFELLTYITYIVWLVCLIFGISNIFLFNWDGHCILSHMKFWNGYFLLDSMMWKKFFSIV